MTVREGRVTIGAIAKEAGVSVPTVSRVLNGRSDVAPETRARVEELLQLRGYRRRRVRSRQARLIDLVFPNLDSPWAVEILRGVEDVTHNAGVGTVVSATHRQSEPARQWLHNLRSRPSDGVILVTSTLETPLLAELQRYNIPLVAVDPMGGPTLDAPTIGATNWAGGLSAMEHLLALGHRRIGIIAGPLDLLCSRARLDGYRAALAGTSVSAEDVTVQEGDFDHQSGFDCARVLLQSAEPPTAIVASSDQMAFGAYEAIRQAGLRIPDDISVVGFDDLPESRWSSPPLTTVRQPLVEMGALAARTILRLAAGESVESPRVELATALIERESSAPPTRG